MYPVLWSITVKGFFSDISHIAEDLRARGRVYMNWMQGITAQLEAMTEELLASAKEYLDKRAEDFDALVIAVNQHAADMQDMAKEHYLDLLAKVAPYTDAKRREECLASLQALWEHSDEALRQKIEEVRKRFTKSQ